MPLSGRPRALVVAGEAAGLSFDEAERFQLERVASVSEAVAWMEEDAPDIVIVLASAQGEDTLPRLVSLVRAMPKRPDLWIAERFRWPVSDDVRAIPDDPLTVGWFRLLLLEWAEEQQARNSLGALNAVHSPEQLRQAHSDFLAMMSHEIRTPLNSILGFADLLLNSNLGSDQRGFVENLRASSEGLLSLINDILDFSKMEAGQFRLRPRPFDVRGAVESAVSALSSGAIQKGIGLRCVVDAGVPAVAIGDPERIRQVLWNLVGNAVKFTREGEVMVWVRAERLTEPTADGETPKQRKRRLIVVISDTGVGISPDHLGRLFEPFRLLHTPGASEMGRTGLGLVISRSLCQLMGGGISVESEEGRGSTFTFDILVELDPEGRAEAATPEEPPTHETTYAAADRETLSAEFAAGHPLRILVAEDNAINQLLMSHLLGRMGYEPDFVANGREAVRAVERGSYDVVLMDIHMPILDGLEAARQILAARHDGRPRLVALTAYAMPGDREMCLSTGMDEYLAKPLRISDLMTVLERCFERLPAPARAVEAGPAALDQSVLSRLRSDLGTESGALISEMIHHFLSDLDRFFARGVPQPGDESGFARAVHNLKSTSAAFGARTLAEAFRKLEVAAREGRRSDFDTLFEHALKEFGRARDPLRGEIG